MRTSRIGWMLTLLIVLACLPTMATQGQELRTVRVGYLHTPAVDTHMWLGIEKGYFAEQGLQLEVQQFNSGPPLAQALAGGSLDIAIMGAVISNFPSRGQGKIFLINDVERDTAQLWVDPNAGITSVSDLAGKRVATTVGTTAHVFLHTAFEANGVDPGSVELVNSDMPGAVNAFISGAVPAVALWAPFDLQVQEQRPDAQLVDSAGTYYPESAIVGGWLANNDVYENDKALLSAISRAWLKANADLVNDRQASLEVVHAAAYSDLPFEQVQYIVDKEELFSNEEWARLYADGTVAGWIGRVEQVFVDIGAFEDYVEPSEFFDTQIYLEAYQSSPAASPGASPAASPSPGT